MRRTVIAFVAASLLVGGPALQAGDRLTGEQQLAKMLEGREAGKPVSCISLMDTRDLQVIDKTALVYKTGGVVYVNRPNNAEHLDSDDILVTYPTGSQFCRLDRVNTLERGGFFMNGVVFLGDFVPYRRVAATN